MGWLSFLFLLHLSTKGFALNECARCKCCKGGATRCKFYNDVSNYCLDGCIDGYYSIRCVHACMNNCLTCPNSQSCIKCSDGYYGAFCSKCPYNCLSCSDFSNCSICKDGFYNGRLYDGDHSDCRNECQSNCKSCTSYQICNKCIAGKYNDQHIDCRERCHLACKSCTSYDTCTECIDGKYNDIYSDCRESCNPACRTCKSYSNCTACQAGKYGPLCQNNCSLGCKYQECDINNGSCTCKANFQGDKCDKCMNGKYGSSCNSDCPHGCTNNSCNERGDCYSCKSDRGFYGPSCQECPENCEDCTSKTQCTVCKSGHWGETCQLSCPSNCASSTCKKETGDCNLHCVLGYWGAQCSLPCPTNCKAGACNRITGVCNSGCRNNYYDEQCNVTCATTCLPDDEVRRCFYTNGSCVKDCQHGYFGDMCQSRCSENCINIICLRASGGCKFGCIGEYEGNECTNTKSGVTADLGNTTDSSNVGAFIGVGVGAMAATLLAVGIFIIIRRHLRHRNLRRHALERTQELTDLQQDNVITMQEPSTIQPTADAGYVNTTFPVYEQLKESNKDLNTYDRIGGTNVN